MKKKNGLPDRWLAYKNMGERIAGTPFIAFKVPLGENFFSRMRISDRFTPDELVDANPDMRLVIDLTNTQRYYSMESIKRKGVKYCKLSCPGRMVPTDRLISRFCDIVHDFLSSCSINGQDTIIGVHCTHGVNRTGFMICSFMIRHLLMHPREAIRVFETARGHTIEREEYVEALIRQYSRNMAQRKRKTPPRGIPRMRSMGDTGDGRQSSLQRYGFGFLSFPSSSTTSWTPSPNPPAVSWSSVNQSKSWKSTDSVHIRWGHTPDPDAGPSRKGVSSEPPYAPQRTGDSSSSGGGGGYPGAISGRGRVSGGPRKGKKDKRFRKLRRPSPAGAEGEDTREYNDRSGQANPESAHLQRTTDASRGGNTEIRYAEKGRRGAASKKQSNARTGARELSPTINAVVSGQSQKDSATIASTPVTQSATSPNPVLVSTSAGSAAKATVLANVLESVSSMVSAADSATVASAVPGTQVITPLSLTFASISPPCTPSPSFPGRSPARSCSTTSRSPLYDSDKAFPSFDSSDDSEASSEFYWRFSSRDSTKANKFDPYGFCDSPPPRCLVVKEISDDSSSDASSSSWGSWPGSNRATSDASYDCSHGPKYDIECVPHYETGSDVEYDPELAPSLSFESGLSPDLSDLDLDALEDELENLNAGGGLDGQRPFGDLVPPNDRPTAPTPPEEPQPPQLEPTPPPPPPPSPPAPPAPQHQVVMPLPPPPQQVLEDLPPRLGFHMNENPPPNQDRERDADRDRDLDWEAILASLHDHTRASAGRASRYAMRSSPAPAPGELGGDTSGDEDEDVVMVGLNRRIRRRRRRSVVTTVTTSSNGTSASTSGESPRRPGERGPHMERGPRASAPARIPSRIGSIRIGGPKEPRFHASPPYTDCKRVKASTLRI